MKKVIAKNVDEYIGCFPKSTQGILNDMRATVKKAAPGAEECIAYAMPAYKLNDKPLIYFAAFENHIGFYATPSGHEEFKKELSRYKQGKGSVQFPIDKPMPLSLVTRIVKFRVKENTAKFNRAGKKTK